jgi:hypothetical protein
MTKIRVIHDTVGKTLTVWLDDPEKEHVAEETAEEVILMKRRPWPSERIRIVALPPGDARRRSRRRDRGPQRNVGTPCE